MPSLSRPVRNVAAATLVVGLLASCAATGDPAATRTRPPSTSPTADTGTPTAVPSDVPTVPGYAVGEVPPVPLVVLPDLAMLDASLAGFAIDVDDAVGDLPGVRVTTLRCDADAAAGSGELLAYGDGSGTFTGPDGEVVTYGDGSGSYTLNGTDVTVFGDGSGTYADGTTDVTSFGDGSGTYDDGTTSVTLFGDGSGTWSRGERSIQNFGDGSGVYQDGDVSWQNFGDGSGEYVSPTLTVQNFGDGTGTVDGVPVRAEPLPPVAPLGDFPSMGVIAPAPSCGTRLVLDATLLFDFDSAQVRPAAAATLDAVAEVLAGVPAARVEGHTDAISGTEYNQDLSERRAAAVVAALQERGASSDLDAVGHGETRPVAPNEVDGVDDPAGRQLNRRVEIVVPS
ncbi:OmpA family protein [Cellulomonas oligotrophica]|uniref:OmpA family protein n=1 Tax=Cellulomonas oligotrophica TaxID=931536 RepID=UPI00357116BA